MSTALTGVTAFILFASLKATMLVAVVLLIQRVARTWLTASARYLLWLSVVVSLVTPVGFDTALPVAWMPDAASSVPPPPAEQSAPAGLPQLRAASAAPLAAPPVRTPEPRLLAPAPLEWLSFLWLAGVLAVAAVIAAASRRLAQLVRRARPAPAALQQLLQACLRQAGYRGRVRLLHSADVEVPMVAGLFSPVLLLPEKLEDRLSREQLRHVFMHELMHLRRGDIAGNWVVALVQALHWFNPAIWYAFFRMRQDRELACDAATLKQLAPSEHAAYGRTLLQLNDTLPRTPTPAVALGIVDSPSQLRARILMLVQFPRSRRVQSYVATPLFLALTVAAFSQPAPREPEAVAAPPRPGVAQAVPALPAPAAVEVAMPDASASTAPAPASTDGAAQAPAVATETPVVTNDAPVAAAPAPVEPPVAPQVPEPVLLARVVPPPAIAAAAPVAAAAVQMSIAEFDAVLAEDIKVLAQEIEEARAAGIPFIEDLENAATECAAKGDGFFATLGAACTKTRRALRRGQLFYFGYQCYLLDAQHQALEERYLQAAAEAGEANELAATLRANAGSLETFCSKDTYAARYPAFAALFADAESLEYFTPGARSVAVDFTNRALQGQPGTANFGNLNWYDIGNGYGGGGIADMYSATASGVVPVNSISTTGEVPPAPPSAAVAQ